MRPAGNIEFGVVGRRDEIQIAVAVEIAPVHCVGGCVDPSHCLDDKLCPGFVNFLAQQQGRQAPPTENDVGQTIGVNIDDGNGSSRVSYPLGRELKAPTVPKHGGVTNHGGEDYVEVAVVIEVADSDSTAIRLKEHRRPLGSGLMIETV